jgi:hypothetical protein
VGQRLSKRLSHVGHQGLGLELCHHACARGTITSLYLFWLPFMKASKDVGLHPGRHACVHRTVTSVYFKVDSGFLFKS